jgi:hypothetical protein
MQNNAQRHSPRPISNPPWFLLDTTFKVELLYWYIFTDS